MPPKHPYILIQSSTAYVPVTSTPFLIQYIKMDEREKDAIALKLKEEGNAFFKNKDFPSAIQKYSEAMTYCPQISILYSNRSRCYRQLGEFQKVKVDLMQSYTDAEKAVNLDQKNIKAYFLMGETLVELAFNSKDRTKIEMAIEKLKKSLRLCPSQGKKDFEERFVDQIYKARKKLWHLTAEESAERKKALRSYLIGIVESDTSISEGQKDSLNENIAHLVERKFCNREKVARALICPITKSIMKDPVCNEYGNSYSRKAYGEELQKNGRNDPLLMKPIKTNILYPNVNLKKAIQNFLERNPWAYDEVIA